MKRVLWIASSMIALAVALVVARTPAAAHHSSAPFYDDTKRAEAVGTVTRFLFRNPHSFVHVMVREKDGTLVRYAVEWSGALQLGIARDTLKIGDRVVISGNPGRNRKDHLLRMLTLHRPKDGFGWGQRPGEVVE